MNPRTREVPAHREAVAGRVGGELGLRSLLHTDLLLSDFPPVPLLCSAPLRRGGGLRILAQGPDGTPGAADRGSMRSYGLLFYSVAIGSPARDSRNLQAQNKPEMASSAAWSTAGGGCDASITRIRSGSRSASVR